MSKDKQEKINDLAFNNFISSIVQATPNALPPTELSTEFNQRKDAEISKIQAEIAVEINKK